MLKVFKFNRRGHALSAEIDWEKRCLSSEWTYAQEKSFSVPDFTVDKNGRLDGEFTHRHVREGDRPIDIDHTGTEEDYEYFIAKDLDDAISQRNADKRRYGYRGLHAYKGAQPLESGRVKVREHFGLYGQTNKDPLSNEISTVRYQPKEENPRILELAIY